MPTNSGRSSLPWLLGVGIVVGIFLLLFGFGSALGFTLALILFAGIRERLEGANDKDVLSQLNDGK